ncbi:thymus-specific serine protease-like [Anopheles marshallii]|uniref:thymus-specific serine protease-like n=1 Tax=Anopheles marshallii TaxID=1521116 RepID=UPI00237A7A61|nr:thymus-specific serine protease-like [Anopheles marshallii]
MELLVLLVLACGVVLSAQFASSDGILPPSFLNKYRSIVPKSKSTSRNANITEEFFTTEVDHFHNQDGATWRNRYLASLDHLVEGGPLLIFLTGDIPLNSSLIDESTLINEMARDLGGAVFALETRFYGRSQPVGDLTVESLRLLNTEQILADVADFVLHLRRTVVGNPYAHPLVAGTGLGGGLATWFRMRYPHLADAAWSSSGYLRAVYDFQDFSFGWAETAIDVGSQECYNRIFIAFHVAQNLFDAGFGEVLYNKLNLCSPVDANDRVEVAYFFSVLMTSIELYTLRNGDVTEFRTVCEDITGGSFATSLDAFAAWFNTRFVEYDGCIIVSFDQFVESLQETSAVAEISLAGERQFLYQQCTEYGWFFTTDSDLQPFGERVQMELYYEMCRRVFGEWITPELMYRSTERTNERFGGSTPNVMQVHFTNGAFDPWRYTSIVSDLNAYALADVIPGELAGSDLGAISEEDDSEQLIAVKRRLKELVESYLFPFNPR